MINYWNDLMNVIPNAIKRNININQYACCEGQVWVFVTYCPWSEHVLTENIQGDDENINFRSKICSLNIIMCFKSILYELNCTALWYKCTKDKRDHLLWNWLNPIKTQIFVDLTALMIDNRENLKWILKHLYIWFILRRRNILSIKINHILPIFVASYELNNNRCSIQSISH